MPGPAPSMSLPVFDPKAFPHGLRETPSLSAAQLNDWLGLQQTPQHQAAVALYHNGGRPEDYRFFVKAGLDSATVHAAFQGLMTCTLPHRDVRIGNLAVALANWFDYRLG